MFLVKDRNYIENIVNLKDRNYIPCEIYIDSSLVMIELSSDLSNIIKTQTYF